MRPTAASSWYTWGPNKVIFSRFPQMRVIVIAWCLLREVLLEVLRGKDNCCKKNGGDSSVQIQIPSASLLLPALTPPAQPTMAPPTDVKLALFRMLENQKPKQQLKQQNQQQQSVQSQLDALTPGGQLALMQAPTTQFPVG